MSNIPEVLNVEQNVYLFSAFNGNGISFSFSYGNYSPIKSIPNFSSYGITNIFSIYVPKNTNIQILTSSGSPYLYYTNSGLFNINPPLAPDSYNIIVTRNQNWSLFRLECAQGSKDQESCGIYYKNNSVGDSLISTYCSAVQANIKNASQEDLDICSCFNSEIPNPGCFNNTCIAKGYQQAAVRNLVNAGCPSYMDCRQYLTLSDEAKQNTINNTALTQNCTQNNVSSPSTKSDSSSNNSDGGSNNSGGGSNNSSSGSNNSDSSSNNSGGGSNNSDSSSNNSSSGGVSIIDPYLKSYYGIEWYFYVLTFFILIFVIFLIIHFSNKKNTNQYYQYSYNY